MFENRRRRRARTGLGLVLVLVVAAGAVLWGASLVSRGNGNGDGNGDGGSGISNPFTGGDDGDDGESEDDGSGWGPAVPASLAADARLDLAGSPDEVALATLSATVASAPVVVTVDADAGPRFEEAVDLASSLRAPVVVTTAVVGPGDGATPASPSAAPTDAAGPTDAAATAGTATSATTTPATEPSAATPATGPSAATPAAEPSAAEPGAPIVATAEDLLAQWGTAHVVAIGTPPVTSATVHPVEVTVVESTASPSPAGDGTESDDGDGAGASASPTSSAGPEVTVTLPDQVTAMLDEAAADPSTGAAAPTVVARGGQDGAVLLRADVAATLEVVGATPVVWSEDDPRRDDGLRAALGDDAGWILAVADEDRPAPVDADWNSILLAAATAPELPGGGLVLFPDRVFVATYGNPTGPALGVLGERDVQGSIDFTTELASQYDGLFGPDVQVQPAFEIITTIASASPAETGDYSVRADLDLITEWVDAATEAGLYVVLDLQPGRTDFLTQAQEVEELLVRPNVGLALDPEWRLEPDQVHLQQIGTVTTAEVNEVGEWLAQVVRDNNLPQKLLIIHNFRLSMLTDREDLRPHPELAMMVHVDGQGQQNLKDDTYRVITDAGPDFLWWGWKNFYDEDTPGIRSPQDTAAVEPQPNFISYQ